MSIGSQCIICARCGRNNMSGKATCFNCGASLADPLPPPRPAQPPKVQEHLLLCVVGFLFPMVGAALGVYGITRSDLAWRYTGRKVIACAIAGVAVSTIIAIACLPIINEMTEKMIGNPDQEIKQIDQQIQQLDQQAHEEEVAFQGLKIIDWSFSRAYDAEDYTSYSVSGEIRNNSSKSWSYIQCDVALYDGSDHIVATGTAYCQNLGLGQTGIVQGQVLDHTRTSNPTGSIRISIAL